MEHQLKIRKKYLVDILEGIKSFEVRKNDRNYQAGDVLILNEWEPADEILGVGDYTGKKIKVKVDYIFYMDELIKGCEYCVMSIRVI